MRTASTIFWQYVPVCPPPPRVIGAAMLVIGAALSLWWLA